MKVTEQIALGLKALSRKAIEAYAAGDYPQALEIFEKAAALEQKANLPARAAESWVNCANVLFAMQRHDLAREKLAAAFEVFKRTGDGVGQFGVLQLQGQLKVEEGDLAGANDLFEACLRLRCGAKEKGTARFQQAALAIRKQDFGRALLLLNRAVDDFEAAKDGPRLVEALRQRAAVHGLRNMARARAIDATRADELEDELQRAPPSGLGR
jgi:tetratricopeptide (TPR) repeat protein